MKYFRKNKNKYSYIFFNNDFSIKSSKDLIQLAQQKNNLYINESLYKFNKNSNNNLLNELIENLIEFRKLCHNKKGKNTFIIKYIIKLSIFPLS